MYYLHLMRNLLALCKLKVVLLILLTAIVGMLLTPYPFEQLPVMIIAMFGIGASAASAAVFNHIIDQNIDAKMHRTRKRPLPQGQITQEQALIWGVILGFLGIIVLWFFVNMLTALLTFSSLIGYAVFYTMYLKRATPQNIVIGGAAGAMPPVLGWSAMTGEVGEYVLLLFLIIFIWTPPHFWSLAVYRHKEYEKANVPMLPVTHSLAFTRTQILLYIILLIIVTLLPYLTKMNGILYLSVSLILNIIFLSYAIRIIKNPHNMRIPKRTFVYSINYLMILFLALLIDHYYLTFF